MYYSQKTTTVNVVKAWRVFVCSLSVIFGYQMLPTVTHAANASEPAEVQMPTQLAATQDPQQEAIQPVKKASFLDIVDTNEKVRYSQSDFFCMAKNIYHEAGHEPVLGRYAVAQVTLNRMKHPEFNKTVCGVVFEPYQFSWANRHSRRWTTPTGPAWEESKRIAREVLAQGKRVNGLDDALFYHATYVRPSWSRTKDRVTRIGLHIFYDA